MYECHIQEPYLQQILDGSKTIEGRVRKDKWNEIKVGDTLSVDDIKFIVTNLIYAESFQDLYSTVTTRLLPSYEGNDVWGDVYSKFFCVNDEKLYGVVGLQLTRL